MIRVVLDTNIVVLALLQPLGAPAQIFVLVLGGSIQACVSGAIYAEYEEVIRRPKFCLSEEVIVGTLQAFREKGFWVRTTETIQVCPDRDDDIFLECAQAAQANYLVTGNLKDFPASWKDTRVVPPTLFLDQLLSEKSRERT